MVAAAIDGVLITSPVASAPKIARLMALHAANGTLMVATDTPENVAALSDAANASGAEHPLAVVVDFDVGTHRTGAAGIDAVLALARAVDDAACLRFAGVQAYYGHIQHIHRTHFWWNSKCHLPYPLQS